jgi:hypothetical protein
MYISIVTWLLAGQLSGRRSITVSNRDFSQVKDTQQMFISRLLLYLLINKCSNKLLKSICWISFT